MHRQRTHRRGPHGADGRRHALKYLPFLLNPHRCAAQQPLRPWIGGCCVAQSLSPIRHQNKFFCWQGKFVLHPHRLYLKIRSFTPYSPYQSTYSIRLNAAILQMIDRMPSLRLIRNLRTMRQLPLPQKHRYRITQKAARL